MDMTAAFSIARTAAAQPLLIDSSTGLVRAAKAWRRCRQIAIDTEFVRVNTYYANLGLIQISDGQTVWLIDPIAVDDLEPLRELLIAEEILKLVHSPSEDLEILKQRFEILPEPLIDTQVAAACLGQSHQLGYHHLIEWLLDLTLDKAATRSDWCRRPLSNKQLHYAAEDVAYLPLAWDLLKPRLMALDRLQWVIEDSMRHLMIARQSIEPMALYKRQRDIHRLNDGERTVLQELCAWRETTARQSNRPRPFILKDKNLSEIARKQPLDTTQLAEVSDLHPAVMRRHGPDIVQRVSMALEREESAPEPPRQLSNRELKILKRLQTIVQDRAAELSIPPAMLAAKRELEWLLRSSSRESLPERLSGWRSGIIGDRLMQEIKDSLV